MMTNWNRARALGATRRRPTVRRLILAGALIGTGAAVLGQAGQTGQRPTFRAGAVLVTVDAYPQQNGKIVEGLTPEDFEISEDGKPQKVEAFDFVRVEPAPTDAARRDPNTVDEGNALAADPKNRVFVAFLDLYHVDVAGSHATRQPLIDTLNRVLAPNDLFGVMTPRMRGRDLTLGRKVQSIDDQLTRYWPWGERFSIINDPEEEVLRSCFPRTVASGASVRDIAAVLRERRREDLTLAALEDLVAHLGDLREARTAVLLFTDGWVLYEPDAVLAQSGDNGSPPLPGIYTGPGGRLGMPSQVNGIGDPAACRATLVRLANLDDKRRFRDLIAEANRHNITFYPINPGGLAVFDTPISERVGMNPNAAPGQSILSEDLGRLRDRVENLKTLAENTDGLAVVNTNDLTAGLRRIADDVSAYYLLGYYSTNTKFDGRFRRIQVKLKRPGVSMKARRGYLAPSEADGRAKAAAALAPSTAAGPSPVEVALSGLARLQSSADVFTYGAVNPAELTIVAEIASARVETGKWGQGADVQAVVTGPNGEALGTATGKMEPAARGALLHVPIATGATGPWRVGVKVTAGGESLEDRATIDVRTGSALLGPPIVYRAAPGPRSPLRPVADFQFRRTERVHVEWPVLKTLDQRQARVLGKNGQPLAVGATLTERDVNGQTMLAADLNLAPLGPGDYVIEVTAGSGAETDRTLVALRVIG